MITDQVSSQNTSTSS